MKEIKNLLYSDLKKSNFTQKVDVCYFSII